MYSRSCRAISIAGFEYEGKHYTIYEGSQLQRKLETEVRYAKEEQLTAAAYGDAAWATQAQNKVRVLKEKYVSVSEAAGLPVKSERMGVSGYRANKGVRKAASNSGGASNGSVMQAFKSMSEYRNASGEFDIESAKESYQKFLTTVPEKNRMYLEQAMEAVEYREIDLEDLSFGYSLKKDTVYYNPNNPDMYSYPFEIVNTHELSHRIDGFFGQSWENEAFCDALQSAYQSMFTQSEDIVSYCKKNDNEGFLSDIFSALCKGEIEFPYSHNEEYWNGNQYRAPMETFANLFSLETIGDVEKLNYLKEKYPEILEAYFNLI